MASAGYRARILNGDFSLSAKLTTISLPYVIDMHDSTTFVDGDKTFVAGEKTSTLSCEGFTDAAAAVDSAAWESAQPFAFAYNGLALGATATIVDTLKSNYETGTAVGSLAAFSLAGQTTGQTDFAVSLHDEVAVTADTNGSAYDGAAASSNGGMAQLHVTAFSGFSAADVIVEDSATGSSGWATIATFTQATGVTSQRVAVTGTVRRYLRYSIDVTGSGSVTFVVLFARR